MLDLDRQNQQWQELAICPGPARVAPLLCAQHNGRENCLYLIGGKNKNARTGKVEYLTDVYEYSLLNDSWTVKADIPEPRAASAAIDIGQSHIFVMDSENGQEDFSASNKTIYAYHTITNTWRKIGTQPRFGQVSSALKTDDGIILLYSNQDIWQGRLTNSSGSFGIVNYTVLIVYLAAMMGVGFYFVNKNKNTDDYFRGGQQSWTIDNHIDDVINITA